MARTKQTAIRQFDSKYENLILNIIGIIGLIIGYVAYSRAMDNFGMQVGDNNIKLSLITQDSMYKLCVISFFVSAVCLTVVYTEGLATFCYRGDLGLRPRLSVSYWFNLIVSVAALFVLDDLAELPYINSVALSIACTIIAVLLVLKAAYITRRKRGAKYGN